MSNEQGQIGPHEGKEFELFEAGKKDLILWGAEWQPDNHESIAKKLGAKLLTYEVPHLKLQNYIYYRSGFLTKAEELRELMLIDDVMTEESFNKKEHKIGELLGYSKADVELFLGNFKKYRSYEK